MCSFNPSIFRLEPLLSNLENCPAFPFLQKSSQFSAGQRSHLLFKPSHGEFNSILFFFFRRLHIDVMLLFNICFMFKLHQLPSYCPVQLSFFCQCRITGYIQLFCSSVFLCCSYNPDMTGLVFHEMCSNLCFLVVSS